jgi:hypothetical protein
MQIPLQPILQASCRALGMIDYIIIRPLFILMRLPTAEVDILSMNEHYQTLLTYCTAIATSRPTLDYLKLSHNHPFSHLSQHLIEMEPVLWEEMTADDAALDGMTLDAFQVNTVTF